MPCGDPPYRSQFTPSGDWGWNHTGADLRVGWTCPGCRRHVSPDYAVCPCCSPVSTTNVGVYQPALNAGADSAEDVTDRVVRRVVDALERLLNCPVTITVDGVPFVPTPCGG